MATYVLVYSGGSGMPETAEAQQALMAAWGAWFEKLGGAVADGGNPFGPSATLTSEGETPSGRSGLTGYSVLTAASLAEATEYARGCPVLADGATVEVYETFDAM
jgi:hypothetical protein